MYLSGFLNAAVPPFGLSGRGDRDARGLVPATAVVLGEELETVPVIPVYQAENWL